MLDDLFVHPLNRLTGRPGGQEHADPIDRLPDLRICFAHGGGAFPGTLARIEKGYHARPDLCRVHGNKNPRSYIGSFYIDSLVHDEASLNFILDLFGAEKIALGSDYPFPLGEDRPGGLIDSMSLGDETKERILSGTALEFLRLDRSVIEVSDVEASDA